MNEIFHRLAVRVSNIVGSPKAFVLAVLVIVTWALCGPFFDYSNTWQLIINTTTTIATLLMVFLIQNTQNRDARAMHLKLDELIKAVRGARDNLIDVEDLTDKELDILQAQYRELHQKVMLAQERKQHKQ